MSGAVRLTYLGRDGLPVVEDLIGPSAWCPLQYHLAIRRQRPGLEILSIEPIVREMVASRSAAPLRWWVTLRVPGRPTTTVLTCGSLPEARRMALMRAEAGAQVVRIVPSNG